MYSLQFSDRRYSSPDSPDRPEHEISGIGVCLECRNMELVIMFPPWVVVYVLYSTKYVSAGALCKCTVQSRVIAGSVIFRTIA